MIAGLELGGTKCVAVLGDADGTIIERVSVPTTDPDTTLTALEAVLDRWRFEGIGIAAFGPLDLDRASPTHGDLAATPKPGWTGARLLGRFRDRYGVPTAIQTDVEGAALAEGRWGAATGLADHVYITIGTGVGIGAIVRGQPVGGVMHGEAGHMRVGRAGGDGFSGVCPFHGDCLEGLVSGPAIGARTGLAGSDVPADHPVWDAVVAELAAALHNLVLTLAPARIAIGGGVFAGRPELFAPLRAALVESLAGYGRTAMWAATIDTRVGPPGLGDLAGPMGAIAVGLGALGR
ncbi:ROK family protein [Sphingomonas donggukensis]|uniref:fructokinase n=1 Tax=Sphingomonas donggukensis TaxID=2949093 RepID=A0ABY4TRK8_9SPHN|nr:ROK family protein [Sphingomonas donggukensis]URW75032.1 ROK family protein [Sphingomonas donggukensis]